MRPLAFAHVVGTEAKLKHGPMAVAILGVLKVEPEMLIIRIDLFMPQAEVVKPSDGGQPCQTLGQGLPMELPRVSGAAGGRLGL